MVDNPVKKRVNLGEVAEAAGVSRMTVSRVLRGASGFSEDTRHKVMQEVERLGYLPNRIAAAFGNDKTSTLVGVCVPRLTSSLFGEALESIDRTLFRLGYQSMVGSSEHDPQQELDWLKGLLAWQPAGILLTGRNRTAETLNLIKNSACPVVEFWDLNTRPIDLAVGFDHFDCGHEMGRYLVSRGYQRLGYVGAFRSQKAMGQQRRKGFEAALKDANKVISSEEVVDDKPTYYAGYYATENLLYRNPDLDCIYFHDDAMAIGGLAYCERMGMSAPEDIGIAGFGGMEAASILRRRLTTTTVPTEQLGKLAAEALIARIQSAPVRDVQVVETRLVPGQTA